MDIAQQVELAILERQKPMNAAIARGDSAVQQFYRGAAVLVTGGSGFLGKQLIEKLFRSCEIKKVYLLLRTKRGKTIQQRLAYILKDPLYDTLRSKKPNFAESIVAVEGDVAELRVGLSDKDWNNITNEVDVIIHMAATVKFDEPLRTAGLINVRGLREILALGRQCRHLKLFTHVSTAFAHATADRINADVMEQFYPSPMPADVFVDLVQSVDEERLNDMTPALIKGWPNTYTFTKAVGEELVRSSAGDLPVCIVKPPVVISAYVEPSPGWIDKQTIMASPMGYLLGSALGVLHVLLVNTQIVVSYAPVDYVNNAVIAAGWDSVQNRQLCGGSIPMYTVSSSPYGTTWGVLSEMVQTEEFYRMSTPRVLWYCYVVQTASMPLYWLLFWLLQYIPGLFLDALVSLLGVRPKGMPALTTVYNKVYKLTMVYRFFLINYWNFRNDNVQAMLARMSPADRTIYNCDMSRVDPKDIIKAACVGMRRFIVKDGLQGSAAGYKKLQRLYYANLVFLAVYAYLLWRLVYALYSALAIVLPI